MRAEPWWFVETENWERNIMFFFSLGYVAILLVGNLENYLNYIDLYLYMFEC